MRRQLTALFIVMTLVASAISQRFFPILPSVFAVSQTIVISEFRTRGPAGGNDEFYELFNLSAADVDISGYKINGSNASGTTSTRFTIPAGVTLQPGQHYLAVNRATTGGYSGTVAGDNPTGFTTGIADDGGVALLNVSNTIIDQVGLSSGSAYKEGTPLANFGGTNSDRSYRRINQCTDTDNNAADFAMVTPSTPENRMSTLTPCGGGDTAPSVTGTTPANNATDVAVNANITINFSEAVTVSQSSFTISCASGTPAFTLSGSGSSYTLDPTTDFGNNEQCTVTVVANQVSDVDTNDPPDNLAADFVFSFTTVAASGACGDPFTTIPVIQGSSTSSPRVGNTEETEGIVTGDFQGTDRLSGFFIQDEAGDGNTATSDGIFISSNTEVNVGDRVRVRGTVVEDFGQTIINNAQVAVCSTGSPTPTPVQVNLPVPPQNTGEPAFLERYEGMLVTFNQTLSVTDNSGLGTFGELVVSSPTRLYIPTNFIDPNDNPPSGNTTTGFSNAPAVAAQQSVNNRSQIIIDDGSSSTNNSPTTSNPAPPLSPIPYLPPGDSTIRLGDTVSNPTGVLSFGFSNYRLQPTTTLTFTPVNTRPIAPPPVGTTNVRVASFNVENYFVTVNDPGNRGPDTEEELTRKRNKVVAALVGLNADVIGLIELERANGDAPAGVNRAAADLAAALTANGSVGTYEAVPELPMFVGTDPDIKNGIIFRTSGPTAVTRIGDPMTDTTAPAGRYSRDPLAQTFAASNGEQFTITVNHFRSKSCSGASGLDADQGDGQSCFNDRRRLQAQSLTNFVNQLSTIDPDVLVVGDLNAYAQEDPIDTLRAANLVDEIDRFVTLSDKYSFTFDGQTGQLDHAFATSSLNGQVTGATIWHINADEPDILDYDTNDRISDSGAGGKPDDRYQPSPYRSADHDPILIGFNLQPALICATDVSGQVSVSRSSFRYIFATRTYQQTLTVTNTSGSVIAGPIAVVFDNLTPDVTAANKDGDTSCALPAGRPYKIAPADSLNPGASASVVVQFSNSMNRQINYTPRVLSGSNR